MLTVVYINSQFGVSTYDCPDTLHIVLTGKSPVADVGTSPGVSRGPILPLALMWERSRPYGITVLTGLRGRACARLQPPLLIRWMSGEGFECQRVYLNCVHRVCRVRV